MKITATLLFVFSSTFIVGTEATDAALSTVVANQDDYKPCRDIKAVRLDPNLDRIDNVDVIDRPCGLDIVKTVRTMNGADLLAACGADSTRNCCNGEDACAFDAFIEIGGMHGLPDTWNLCNGKGACKGFMGSVLHHGSCNGINSCRNAANDISHTSCNGKNACLGNTEAVGMSACNGRGACKGNSSPVGNNSCNGKEACQDNAAEILSDSCNAKGSCKLNDGTIGERSCNALDACKANTNTIPSDSCNTKEECAL